MERRGSELIGKPVITFDSGRRLAHVEDLLIDHQQHQVLALLVDKGAILEPAKVVPFGRSQAIGDNAVIVPNGRNARIISKGQTKESVYDDGTVYSLSIVPQLKPLFDGRTIRGMRVYSETG